MNKEKVEADIKHIKWFLQRLCCNGTTKDLVYSFSKYMSAGLRAKKATLYTEAAPGTYTISRRKAGTVCRYYNMDDGRVKCLLAITMSSGYFKIDINDRGKDIRTAYENSNGSVVTDEAAMQDLAMWHLDLFAIIYRRLCEKER